MEERDDWGRDPGVRRLREVFAAMEEGHRAFLARTGLSAFDPRLRGWRARALVLFERTWARDVQAGGRRGVADVYVTCLEEVLAADGVRFPEQARAEAPR